MSTEENIARAGIFERLIDNDPLNNKDTKPMLTFSKRALMDSVALNISQILNTRSSCKYDEFDKMELSVLNFGIPDFSYLSSSDEADKRKVLRFLKEAIEFYEPRLKNIIVRYSGNKSHNKLFIQVEANYRNEFFPQPVSFPITIRQFNIKVIVNVG